MFLLVQGMARVITTKTYLDTENTGASNPYMHVRFYHIQFPNLTSLCMNSFYILNCYCCNWKQGLFSMSVRFSTNAQPIQMDMYG